ncbi:sensor histidine kinase [Chamaesiphon sp.]|uniref:sensor histidine kinase n=1 Tax=Chamaesiphon sp. TaxID=2814140 RepID=UPI00359464BE
MNSSPVQSRSSPIQLLLLLEWVLLAIAAIVQILVTISNPDLGLPLLNMLGLILFAAIRWCLPDRWSHKLLYTAAEFGLLLLLTFVGDFPSPSLLYVVLTMRNCILLAGQDVLEGKVRSTITLLALVICLLSQTYRLWSGRLLVHVSPSQIGSVWIGFSIVLGLVFLFLHLLVDAILAERKGQEQLAAANMRLCEYALRVEELATAQERNRIARDIHDSLGHSLTVFNIHIGAVLRLLHKDPLEAEALLLEVKDLGSQALQEVRQSVTLLRAEPLKGRSLDAAIGSLATEFQRTTGINPTFTYRIAQSLSAELNYTLYRLVQESLTNIYKHAAATQVSIEIEQIETKIQAIVRDNGKGFALYCNPAGFGLQGMRERTLAVGGILNIQTALTGGCQIQAIFPVDTDVLTKN